MQNVLANVMVSISEFKKDPSAVIAEADGTPVAILNHNRVMGYLVPARLYEQIMERLEDLDLIDVIKARSGEQGIPMSLDDL
ncbi:type II toxin-antitoxin system Phd/YefM family antitoxin [Pseudomonas aeruginosa]|uniref:type II toxin-antitoxin system Phd/YefM family antitoxin n=1 Tax=Pseudomonas aeruginosa TaxID=287 RepID=UPI000F542070|nr:type II toxin-antitoxin system prevent-host-death family antitoxin [Pseudomonas aeruginosa]RQJ19373.1 antitoxin [Pseudomonas aeruginosa]